MPEINWDITPGWGGTGRLAKFAGRRKAKEWNLIGALFSAETAERHNLINRLCEPEKLDDEVNDLVEVLMAKSPRTLLCTKYFVDHGADLDMWSSLWFEGAPQREPFGQGIRDFATKLGRDARRELVKNFWQE
jgi:enoyl-CoA hydratase